MSRRAGVSPQHPPGFQLRPSARHRVGFASPVTSVYTMAKAMALPRANASVVQMEILQAAVD